MSEIKVTREVKAPADAVWDVLTDLEGSPETISGITAVERLDELEGFAVGTKWRETRVLFGKEATEVMEVTEIDPGRSYTVYAASRGNEYTSIMSVEPAGEGSTVGMSFVATPTGGFSRLMASTIGKMFEGTTRKAIEQDLADIASAAENR